MLDTTARHLGLCVALLCLAMLAAPSLAAAQSSPESEPTDRVGYDATGLFAESADGRYRFRLSNRIMFQLEVRRNDEGEPTRTRFRARRVRTSISGNVFSTAVRYKLQFAWEQGQTTLYDAEIDFVLDRDWLSIRVGQGKVATSRNFITSSASLELVDRPITHDAFFNDRDIGVTLHNGLNRPFEYSVGVYNGADTVSRFRGTATVDPVSHEGPVTGGFVSVPDTFRPLFAARLATTLGHGNMYSEADLDGGEFGIGVGLSGYATLDADDDDETTAGGTFDFMTKVAAFSLTGAASLQHFETDEGDSDMYGGFAQAGYAIGAGELATVQPAARYAVVVDRDGDRTRHEAGGGLSVYFAGHRLKLQTDAFALIDQEDDAETVDARVRAQVQVVF